MPRAPTPASPEDVRHAVMTAVYDELTRWGPGAVRRPDDVRTSQKIDESVVTKYWGGDGSRLALEALLYWSNDVLTAPDTGSLRTDLQALATAVAEQVNDTMGRSLLRAMVVDDRAAFADDTRMAFWMRRFAGIRSVFSTGQPRAVSCATALTPSPRCNSCSPPINVRALYTREPIADHYCAAIADLAWHAIAKR